MCWKLLVQISMLTLRMNLEALGSASVARITSLVASEPSQVIAARRIQHELKRSNIPDIYVYINQ